MEKLKQKAVEQYRIHEGLGRTYGKVWWEGLMEKCAQRLYGVYW